MSSVTLCVGLVWWESALFGKQAFEKKQFGSKFISIYLLLKNDS